MNASLQMRQYMLTIQTNLHVVKFLVVSCGATLMWYRPSDSNHLEKYVTHIQKMMIPAAICVDMRWRLIPVTLNRAYIWETGLDYTQTRH